MRQRPEGGWQQTRGSTTVMAFPRPCNSLAITIALSVGTLLTSPQSQAGGWFACAVERSSGNKALVVGTEEVSLDPAVPFQAIPMPPNPKLMLASGATAGRCYLTDRQERAVLNR